MICTQQQKNEWKLNSSVYILLIKTTNSQFITVNYFYLFRFLIVILDISGTLV